ncbi:MAG: bifunctional (p)ppGpp synthetase/guanosine-3',5'-bis(diphosphate) 3'-pyrophosphohydrolase [Gammaproteobacteria bacterium]|nr:bifunctional (p)ppGpp synthetase/guanosine-3',5'-bis(diphosphate) 3'-pyrophosphohydrolase [Gammaproteobacteria bacterium]MCP5139836.1 bifunctional (p)ppGpp synthetase/guanosine-3',5'-bis(diphosphate) 3'-pyrophosphohydrolase [Chromatiales bacterium]
MDYAATILNHLPLTRRTSGLAGLLAKTSYLTRQQLKLISEAHAFSASRHEGQKRQSGDAYITHPLAVAGILADLHLDYPSIAAALLHDVIEDTPTAKDEIAQKFGAEIASLVDGVSKLEKLNFNSRSEMQVESFRKMMLAMVQDIRVILLKLADRLHNMQTLDSVSPEKQSRIARETLEIYAPIANRLGMNSLKTELEDLGFRYAHPFRYRVLDKAVRRAEGNQRQFVKNISEKLNRALREAGLNATVTGRKKHLYSIYRKMETKKRSMADIADVFGFRVVVDSVDECYRVLGVVHQIFKPMPGRFKDYIAIPRINGYQSLHTSLFGPSGTPIEVQIRTTEMARVAETGVAAHWHYKETDQEVPPPQARAREWLASINEMQSSANSEEFMEHVKVDLFPDAVYIFTPKGEIMRLPRGATCVDFAYAVHTDVGNRCVAAKIDRRLVPLRTQIENGQTVEIITAKTARPNPSWVNFVVTAKARTAVRQYLKNLRQNEAQDLGRRLLDQAMRDAGTPLRKISSERMQALLTELKLKSADELFRQLGLGERLAPLVAKTILQPAAVAGSSTGATPAPASAPTPIAIAGTEGLVVSYARCCHPIPGDAIMGYLSAGRGVVIHRNVCGNLSEYRKQPNKWITVSWQPGIDREFSAEIRIDVDNRPGVLAEVASRIADAGSNIEQVSIDERHDDSAAMLFSILVRDRKQLAQVIRSIRRMKVVKKLSRTCT